MTKGTTIALLAFALAGAEANQQFYKELYSDAFIVENAFQPDSNAMPFDLAMHPITERIHHDDSIRDGDHLIDPKLEDLPHYDPKEVKEQMKMRMDLDLPAQVSSTHFSPGPQHGVATVYMPGTTFPIVSTVPKDDPREVPVHESVPTVYD